MVAYRPEELVKKIKIMISYRPLSMAAVKKGPVAINFVYTVQAKDIGTIAVLAEVATILS